jgi:hypothetical protein
MWLVSWIINVIYTRNAGTRYCRNGIGDSFGGLRICRTLIYRSYNKQSMYSLLILLLHIQGDSELGGKILGTCSTNENKAKTPHKHVS